MTFFQPYDRVTQLLHEPQRVAHHQNRAALATKLLDFFGALALELLVTDGENFINQQHFGFNVGGYRKAKSHHHSRGEILHGSIDELL